MGILGDIFAGGAKGTVEGFGELAKDLRTAITGLDPEVQGKLEIIAAKITELQTVIAAQFRCYFIKKCLDYTLDQNSFSLCAFCYTVNKFFLRDCCHKLPRFGKECLRDWVLVDYRIAAS